MQKQYKLKLANKGEKVTVPIETGDVEVDKREAEIGILQSLISMASGGIKDLSNFNTCLDMIRVIDNLDDTADLTIDETDLKNLQEGFKASAGKRRPSWIFFPGIFEQIDKPEEIKPEEKPA